MEINKMKGTIKLHEEQIKKEKGLVVKNAIVCLSKYILQMMGIFVLTVTQNGSQNYETFICTL